MASPLKVLISGGGIAGPSLAFWLTRVGCNVTVVERFGALRASGQQIDIRAQAVTVMRRMGIEPAVRAHRVDEPGVQFIDGAGKRWAYIAANTSGKGAQTMTSEFEIMRGDLCHILHDATKAKTRYIFGAHVTDFDQLEGDRGVRVRMSDGTEDTFDLLVGADGQNSRVRQLMTSKSGMEDTVKRPGMNFAWFSIPPAEGDTSIATACMSANRRMTVTRRDRTDSLRVYYMYATSGLSDEHPAIREIREGTVEDRKKAMAEHFKDAGYRAERFVKGMDSPQASDFYSTEAIQIKLSAYSQGRVVLVGDAGLCPSPLSGMGTAVALVSAYCLAGEIARHCHLRADGTAEISAAEDPRGGLAAALKGYEQQVRPFAEKVQELPPGVPDFFMPKSRWGVGVFNWTVWFLATIRLDKLLSAVASDDVGGWDLPHYTELNDAESK